MANMVKITSYFTRSSEEDECSYNMELLPEGDNQLLCEGEKELGRDNGSCDNELPQDSDNELPHNNSDSEDGREVSRSSKAKRRRVDKHSTGFDSTWVYEDGSGLRQFMAVVTVVGLLFHLCQKHKTTAHNGSTKWSREPCMYMRADSIQHHLKSHQHAGPVAKEHALLQSGDIGCTLSSETRKPISRNREEVVGVLRSLCFLVKHSLPHTTILVHSLTSAFCKDVSTSQTVPWQATLTTIVRELFKSFLRSWVHKFLVPCSHSYKKAPTLRFYG